MKSTAENYEFSFMGGAQFIQAKHTPNSKVTILCTESRPCKRIASCLRCKLRRRGAFIENGIHYSRKYSLELFLTISFLELSKSGCGWAHLIAANNEIAKSLSSSKPTQHIRSLGRGAQGCFHVHILTSEARATKIEKLVRARKFANRHRINLCLKRADGIEGLLGYFFDQNFFPAYIDPDRPPRVRILSASRGMACGFPGRKKAKSCILNVGAACPDTISMFGTNSNCEVNEHG